MLSHYATIERSFIRWHHTNGAESAEVCAGIGVQLSGVHIMNLILQVAIDEAVTNVVKGAIMAYVVYTAMCHSDCNRFMLLQKV